MNNEIQIVNIESKDNVVSINQTTGVYTTMYKNEIVSYMIEDAFCKAHNISDRSLRRYRRKIEVTVPMSEQPAYFCYVLSKCHYREKILDDFRKNKPYTNKQRPKKTYSINDEKGFKLIQFNPLYRRIENYDWQYKGGGSYRHTYTVEGCVKYMYDLHKILCGDYPDAKITIFFTTEEEELFHNHIAISIKGSARKVSQRKIQKAIVKASDTHKPFCEVILNEQAKKQCIEYMTKDVLRFPDGWGILSNSNDEIRTIAHPIIELPKRNLTAQIQP